MTDPWSEDAQRVLDDYAPMSEIYADDADRDPMKVAYDRPAMLAMAGDMRGLQVLDVGCATGALSAAFVERGASVVGVDVDARFVARAQARLGGRATFHVADLAAPLPFLDTAGFDIVAASLVLHYLRDWGPTLAEFARVLRPGGRLLISTHHPTHDIEVADPPAPYFATVLLTDTWRKGGRDFKVRAYHRPLSAIVDALADAGFLIERIPEPIPDPAAFAADAAFYARITKVPWYLFIRAVKRS